MSFLETMLGPKSKYDKSLPYTYEARIRIFEESEEYKSYFSDTVCGLVEYLHRNSIPPDGIEIFGVYQEHESPIDARFFNTSDRQWLFKRTSAVPSRNITRGTYRTRPARSRTGLAQA